MTTTGNCINTRRFKQKSPARQRKANPGTTIAGANVAPSTYILPRQNTLRKGYLYGFMFYDWFCFRGPCGRDCHGASREDGEVMDYTPFPKPILTDDTATIRLAGANHCQVCARPFTTPELVWWIPLDGNTACQDCSRIHLDLHLRIYVGREE